MTEVYSFEILANPNTDTVATQERTKSWIYIFAGLLLLLLLLMLVYAVYPYYKRGLKNRKLAYENSEEGRYKKLLLSSSNSDLYANFYFWLECISPKTAKVGFRGLSALQPSFESNLSELENALAKQNQVFSKDKFFTELKILREYLQNIEKNKAEGLPKELNPQ